MFKDEDIALHLRKIGLSRGSGVTRYAAIGIPGGPDGEGKEPHMAKIRRQNTEIFSLADATPACGWQRLSDLKREEK